MLVRVRAGSFSLKSLLSPGFTTGIYFYNLCTSNMSSCCNNRPAPHSHVIYDALRVGDPKQHGVPPHIMAFLWACGWVAYNIGNQLLIVTWVSFSSKDLMARPALTGHPTLFWSTTIPFTVVNIVASLLCGVNYWYYWVSMRVAIAAWAAFALVTALFAGYYGNQMLVRLNKSRDSFNWKQQFRVLVCLVFMLVSCGICLGIQSYFLTRIDEIYQVFIAVTSLYRLCGLFILVGSAAYVWYSTTHYVSHSTRGSNSDKSAYKSTAPRNGYISSTGGSMEDRTAAATAALNNDSSTTTSSNMEEDNYEDDPKEDDGEEYEAEEDGGIIEENSSSTEDSESESSSSRGDENV